MVTKTIDKPAKATRLHMDYEAYLDWAGEDNKLVEWVNGEVIVHMPPSTQHQKSVFFLSRLIGEFVSLFDLGQVIITPFEVKLWPDGPSREPDLLFLKKENRDRLSSKRLNGPPDLAVEIISPDSVRRDRDEKQYEYAQAGVPEYWVIDSRPGRQRADFYHLMEDGRYKLAATEDDEKVESLALPGFWLNPNWLWQEPHPNVIATLYHMSPETAVAIQSQLSK